MGSNEDQREVGEDEEVEFLFPLGDTRTGLMWSMMLRQYTSVRRWFEKSYGLTDDHLQQLEVAAIGVPLAVHLVLMQKVNERMAGVEGIIVPTAYKRLMALPQSAPVRDGTYVLNQLTIPCQDWLKKQES